MIVSKLKEWIYGWQFIQRFSVSCCATKRLLPALLTSQLFEANSLRSQLFLPRSNCSSQLNQDIFALLVNQFRPGYFVEIGANNGYTLSNTLYLEQHFNWSGLLIEANPIYESSLLTRKASYLLNAISESNTTMNFVDGGLYGGLIDSLGSIHNNKRMGRNIIPVKCLTLEQALDKASAPKRIDYLSLDVEGAETQIVRQLTNSKRYRFTCGTIEHNYRVQDKLDMTLMLEDSGYLVAWKETSSHDLFFIDSTVIHNS
jgi:FkbM family methyltransferase